MPRRPKTASSDSPCPAGATNVGCQAMRPIARKTARKSAEKAPHQRRVRSPLEVIPGVGVAAVEDLNRLGVHEVADLKGQDPQRLYDDICALDGVKHDRCVLYVFRCAVYYASKRKHDPEKLKWWNWKD